MAEDGEKRKMKPLTFAGKYFRFIFLSRMAYNFCSWMTFVS